MRDFVPLWAKVDLSVLRGVLENITAKTAALILMHNTSNDAVSRMDVCFGVPKTII